MAQYQNQYGATQSQTDHYGNPIRTTDPVRQTDEYGNLVHQTGTMGDYGTGGQGYGTATGMTGTTGDQGYGTATGMTGTTGDQGYGIGTTAPTGGYGHNTTTPTTGYGTATTTGEQYPAKRGIMEKIKERLPCGHSHY